MKSENHKTFGIGDWVVDPATDRIRRGNDTHSLRPKTMDVLVYLAKHQGDVVSAGELIEALWPGVFVSDASVYACINQLREAFGDDSQNPEYIETIPKRGYRLTAPVNFDAEDSREAARTLNYKLMGLTAAVLLVFIGAIYGLKPGGPTPETNALPAEQASIAVMPFIDLSPANDQEYFAEGISEELMNALAGIRGLRVTGRTSSFSFKGQETSVMEIGEVLGVSTILEGSFRREGDRVRIAAQLVSTADGFQIWSQTYERKLSSVFDIQKEIAGSIVGALEVFLTDARREAIGLGGGKIASVGTDNVAAYDKYLQGLQQKNISGNTPLLLAEISFREALALDPGFYEARLALGYTYSQQLLVGEITFAEASEHLGPILDRLLEEKPDDGLVLLLAGNIQRFGFIAQGDVSLDVAKHLANLTAAIERTPNEPRLYLAIVELLRLFFRRPEELLYWLDRGIEIDPLDWALHFYRGLNRLNVGDLDGAEASFARAIEVNPENPTAYGFASEIPGRRKQHADSFAMLRKAMEVDPLDNEIPAMIALKLYTFGLMDEGDKYLQRAITIAPNRVVVRTVRLYRVMLQGDRAQAREMSETILRDDLDNRFSVYWIAVMVFMSTMTELDKTDEALAILEELRPGVLSLDFQPRSRKEQVLQYHAVLAKAQSLAREDVLAMLEPVVQGWDESFPLWRDSPGLVAPIAMARGQMEFAVELTLKDLEIEWTLLPLWSYLIYRHIDYYKALAMEPAVAERLTELDAEVKKGGEDIWAHIVEQKLQL